MPRHYDQEWHTANYRWYVYHACYILAKGLPKCIVDICRDYIGPLSHINMCEYFFTMAKPTRRAYYEKEMDKLSAAYVRATLVRDPIRHPPLYGSQAADALRIQWRRLYNTLLNHFKLHHVSSTILPSWIDGFYCCHNIISSDIANIEKVWLIIGRLCESNARVCPPGAIK
jgi:hypothetical protein